MSHIKVRAWEKGPVRLFWIVGGIDGEVHIRVAIGRWKSPPVVFRNPAQALREWRVMLRHARLWMTPWPVYFYVFTRYYCDPAEWGRAVRYRNGRKALASMRMEREEIESDSSFQRISRDEYIHDTPYHRDIAAEMDNY